MDSYFESQDRVLVKFIYIGLILGVIFSFWILLIKPENEAIGCIIRTAYHLNCPMCGGTTALYRLFRGDILGSLRSNPIDIYLIIIASSTLITYWKKRKLNWFNRLSILILPLILLGIFYFKNFV